MRAHSLAGKFNTEIGRFTADRIGGVNCPCRINEKTGTGEFAVLVNGMDFDDCFSASIEHLLHFATDAGRCLLLCPGRNSQPTKSDQYKASHDLTNGKR